MCAESLEVRNNHKNCVVTKHAFQRFKERSGLNKKASKRIAEKALKNGEYRQDMEGELRWWVDEKFFRYDAVNTLIIYGDKLFIFDTKTQPSNILITVIQVPAQLRA